MNFLQELIGGQQKPTAQEMAGGIPQNADTGKRPLGNGILGLRGSGGGGGMKAPPVQQDQAPSMAMNPAQLMPQDAPPAPAMSPTPPMQAMGGMGMAGPAAAASPMMGAAPQMQGNPQMLQALLARRQAMQGQGAY